MSAGALETLLQARPYHLKSSSCYHLYVSCKHIAAKEGTGPLRAEELREGAGGRELCRDCKDTLSKAVGRL